MLAELLASKSKTDVLESMNFFVVSHRFQISNYETGVRKMIHLIWSKDSGDKESNSIKEYLIQNFIRIYIDCNSVDNRERTRTIVRNLIS